MPGAASDFDLNVFAGIVAGIGGSIETAQRLHGGSVNITHRVQLADGAQVVVRFPRDPLKPNQFPVEMWAAHAAADAGIPTAAALRTGLHHDVPFMVSEYIAPATETIPGVWTWLGSYARRIGTIDLRDAPPSLYSRFGDDLAAAWASHVGYNVAALAPDDPLGRDGAYGPETADRLRRLLRPLASAPFAFGLAHGDLAPRNLLSRGREQAPVLIDWGTAATGPTPWTDASRVFEWAYCEHSIVAKDYDEFAVAAGLGGKADRRVIVSMVALQALDVTRWAHDRRPDLYDDYVQKCRRNLAAVTSEL